MCLKALTNLYLETKERKYLDFSKKIADWIIEMQKPSGLFYVRDLLDQDKLVEDGNTWSEQSGSFLVKNAIVLAHLCAIK
jgi:uncharacterized protein YyaL (SSP411 family)